MVTKASKSVVTRLLILAVVAIVVGLSIHFNLVQYLSLDYIKSQQAAFTDYYLENRLLTIAIFMGIYILATALSLPGAAVLTLLAGALFGLVVGTVVVSFASTIGATLAFLAARFLLRDFVQNKFGAKLAAINRGVEKEGAFYLFTMRLVPIFPFFAINLLMGLTPISVVKYAFVSQLGMLAGTIVYVLAGTEISKIETLSGILSPSLWVSFILLGLFPLIAKKIVGILKKAK